MDAAIYTSHKIMTAELEAELNELSRQWDKAIADGWINLVVIDGKVAGEPPFKR